MVSFFGLKIGGDKKKKSSKDPKTSPLPPQNLDDPNAIDSSFFDLRGLPNPSPAYEASVYSLSRQESRQSTQSKRSIFKGFGKFASSVVDLAPPSGLRHHTSNPSLGRRWNTGSSTSLNVAPPSFGSLARPSTSDGRSRPWLNPLDVNFAPDSSGPASKGPLSPATITPLSTTSKSPLGQYELKLDLPDDVASFADLSDFKQTANTPAALRLKKSPSTNRGAELSAERPSQKPFPSSQSSVDRIMPANLVQEPLRAPADAMRPVSPQTHHNAPLDPKELQRTVSNSSYTAPASLSSPSPSTSRASEEKQSTSSIPSRDASPSTKRTHPKPVIQNVRAKRDTLTINPQHRRSLEKRIEAAEAANIPPLSLNERPKTSSGGRPIARPPPLTLNIGFRSGSVKQDGPRSAPFSRDSMWSLTPSSLRPPRPPAQRGVQAELKDSACTQQASEHRSQIASSTASSIYDDDDEDDDVYSHPPSPESNSPVMPLTGPLASPRFPPSQSPHSISSVFKFPRGNELITETDLSPITPPVPPRSVKRVPPTPDSSYWPVTSPVVPSPDRAAKSPSPADSRLRSESESESSLYESLELPRIPGSRSGAESPTFRSFSRPWTPTTTCEGPPPLSKRSESARISSRVGMEGEIGGGLRPPPRSVPYRSPTLGSKGTGNLIPRAGENRTSGGFI